MSIGYLRLSFSETLEYSLPQNFLSFFEQLLSYTIKAVSEHFSRDPVAITQGVKKLEERLREERDSQQAIERIEKTLTKKCEKKYLVTYA